MCVRVCVCVCASALCVCSSPFKAALRSLSTISPLFAFSMERTGCCHAAAQQTLTSLQHCARISLFWTLTTYRMAIDLSQIDLMRKLGGGTKHTPHQPPPPPLTTPPSKKAAVVPFDLNAPISFDFGSTSSTFADPAEPPPHHVFGSGSCDAKGDASGGAAAAPGGNLGISLHPPPPSPPPSPPSPPPPPSRAPPPPPPPAELGYWIEEEFTFAPFIDPATQKRAPEAEIETCPSEGYTDEDLKFNRFEEESTSNLMHPGGVATMPHGWCMVTDSPCDPQFIRIISPTGYVTTCGQGVRGFADGKGQAACFNEPYAIGLLPDGVSCVVSDRSNHKLRIVTTDCVASTMAGSGAKGMRDGTLQTATFCEVDSIAVDVDGRIVVTDNGPLGSTLELKRTVIRIIDPATDTVKSLPIDQLELYGSVAISDDGSLWYTHEKGIDIITGTGLNSGHHAWSHVLWAPNAARSSLCTSEAKAAVWTVLSICARTFVETEARAGETLWLLPELPIELWLYILAILPIRQLGAWPAARPAPTISTASAAVLVL